MKKRTLFPILILASLALSQEDPRVMKAAAGVDAVPVRTATIRRTIERKGTFVPAEGHELAFDLEVYRGSPRLAEIAAHGSRVNQNDVVARFDTTDIDEQIVKERMALERAELDFRHAEEKARMGRENDAVALALAQRDADRAAKRLRGFREHEKAHRDESERLSVQSRMHRIEDQKDELDQLEKMYSEDELVDATEEIVLKRSRRNFARSRQSTDLSERRRLYNKEWYEHWREEDLERAAQDKARAVETLRRKQELGREKTEAEMKQKRYDLRQKRERFADLQKEREQFTMRAPARGIVLHGAADAAPWTTRHEAGDTAKNRQVVATVGSPSLLRVETDVPEAEILNLRPGAAAEVFPTAAPGRRLVGTLRFESMPQKGGTFPAEIELAGETRGLRPGLTAKVVVVVEEARDALVVPRSAVYKNGTGTVVRTAKSAGGPFEVRPVKTGPSDGNDIAIIDGLEAGDYVVKQPEAK